MINYQGRVGETFVSCNKTYSITGLDTQNNQRYIDLTMTIQDTSIEAYESLAPHRENMTEQVFDVILEAGSHGCTDDEIEVILSGRHQTISSRRNALAKTKRIVKTGEKRINRSKRRGNVWVVSKFNSTENPDSSVIYEDYIQSPEWQAFKDTYYQTHDKKCAITGDTENVELHHKTYVRLGDEDEEDVIPLSKPVHEMVHRVRKENVNVDLHDCHNVVKSVLDCLEEGGVIDYE